MDSVLGMSSQNGICINQCIKNEPRNISNTLIAAQYAIKQKGIRRFFVLRFFLNLVLINLNLNLDVF